MAAYNAHVMISSRPPGRALPASVPAGVLATLTMDAAMVVAGSCARGAFSSDKIGIDMIGRWAGGLARGRRRPSRDGADITAELELRAGSPPSVSPCTT